MLQQRYLQGRDTMFAAMEAAGGLFIVEPGTDPEVARRAVLEDGVRALEVQTPELEWLEGLPLEFLMLNATMPAIYPVNALSRLRGLRLDAWTGELELRRLTRLEWFGAIEPERRQLDAILEAGHPRLRCVEIGRFADPDAARLASMPAVEHLSIGHTRRLARLDGLAALPRLRLLELYLAPRLASLDALRGAEALGHLGIDGCHAIGSLEPLAALAGLRSLQLAMRSLPSFTPLIGHPGLEFVWLVGARRRDAAELDRLLANPRLRMLAGPRGFAFRDADQWRHIPDIYAMTPDDAALYEAVLEERAAVVTW